MTNEQLVAEYAATRSPRVLDELVRRNQRLLHHLLKRFAYAQEPYEDLLQVANLGLLKAVQRFDPEKGRTFSTYAAALIEGEIRHHLRDSLLLRQPRWVRKVHGQISEAQAELTRKLQRTPTLSELSEKLNITEQGIIEVLQLYARVGARRGASHRGRVHRRRRARRRALAAPAVLHAARRGPHHALRRPRQAEHVRAQDHLPALLPRVHAAGGGRRPSGSRRRRSRASRSRPRPG